MLLLLVFFLLKKITCIAATEGEIFLTNWDRFMELLDAYPDHGHDAFQLMDFFYSRMKPSMKRLIHTLSRGDFVNKTHVDAMKFLVEIA